MPSLTKNPRGLAGYALGVALFGLAFILTTTVPWVRSHYPYMAYLFASLGACYLAGFGPASLTAALSAFAVYRTHSPVGFFVSSTQTPRGVAIAMLVLLTATNWLVGSLKQSRDRLAVEGARCAKLAETRDVLYRELQHRVSNNIQIIAGLLLLQSQAVTDAGAKRALAEASGRINLIARIQRRLHDQTGEATAFRVFATQLLTDAIAAAGTEGVRVEIHGGEAPLHVDQATPVSLVLLECVNNALEHAYGAGTGGLVRVSLLEDGAMLVLTVCDDGRGLPEGFDIRAGNSLGLKIVLTMAAQLDGDFSIAPGAKGSICRLQFPRAA